MHARAVKNCVRFGKFQRQYEMIGGKTEWKGDKKAAVLGSERTSCGPRGCRIRLVSHVSRRKGRDEPWEGFFCSQSGVPWYRQNLLSAGNTIVASG